MRNRTEHVIALIAGVAVLAGMMSAVPASADEATQSCTRQAAGRWPPAISRVAGADRYATAVEISKMIDLKQRTIYIANGTSFADALTAGAGSGHDFPTLLVASTGLPDIVRQEILRRRPDRIIVVGGERAVSAKVYRELSVLAGSIQRVSGSDRYDTSRRAIERDLAASGAGRDLGVLNIATGRNYPDALAANAVFPGAHLLLVDGAATRIDAPTTAFIRSVRMSRINILGGTSAISSAWEASLRDALPSVAIRRIAGKDRYHTSQSLVNAVLWNTGIGRNDCKDAILVTGKDFPDALAAGSLAAGSRVSGAQASVAPMWVVPPTCVPQAVLNAAKALRVERFWLVGGPGALGEGVKTLTTCESMRAQAPVTKAGDGGMCSVLACVALTFDDGPGPYTDKLLDILAAKQVKATFFVVGQMVAARPETVRRAVEQGHAVGNHSWNHPDLTKLGADAVALQINRAGAQIAQATGVHPTLFRAPYGALNTSVRRQIAAAGYTSVLWSVDPEDWRHRNVSETTARAVGGAHPGAIILLHDIHSATVEAVPGIIDQLRAKGYTLVTVPELLG